VNPSELKRAKRSVRTEVRAMRDAIPAPERARLSAEIGGRFLALPEVRSARRVMAFWSFGSEVGTNDLIRELHGRHVLVALPAIVDGDLAVRAYAPGDPVAPTSFGSAEPVDGDQLDPTTLDVVVVPGVAFDRRGRRVGYGGGFYDRFLRTVGSGAFLPSLAFSVQIVDAPLPAGNFDLPVDAIVTEHETIRIAPDRAPT
jgi:5-formyltetrahydrofolate cyclo-ligase